MSKPNVSFYNLAWRWHFYAGLFVAPFMILLSLTGIIYLFKPQLDSLMYSDLLTVTPAHHQLSADEQQQRVLSAYPKGQISKYLPPINPQSSAQFVIKLDGRDTNLFIDPYTGDILGTQDAKNNLQAIARELHGELMIGTVGDRLVELAAGWGIVLVVSGLYLWWPRGRAAGVLWPRMTAKGRVLWRDLHAVTGFWGSVALLFMLLSGMTWTGLWGKVYADVWNTFPAAMWNEVPKSDRQARELNTASVQTVPWALENTPMPVSTGEHAEHMQHEGMHSAPAAPTVTLQRIVDIAKERNIEPGYSITPPKSDKGVFTVSVFADDPHNDATLHIDQYSGKVLADVRYQDYSAVSRATELGVMLHEGKMFGWVNQIAILLICLMVLLSSVSGLVIWWKRRPQNAFGVPPLRHDLPRWKFATAVMLVLGVAFPLVGISMLVVWLLDRIVRSSFAKSLTTA